MKKAAIIIYPEFSMYEISLLTALFWFNGKEIKVFSSAIDKVRSEDGLTLVPDEIFENFNREEFDCIILPGINNPFPVVEDENIVKFLNGFVDDSEMIIGSISSSPIVLGKAGLLKDRKFTGGILEETYEELKYLPKENVVRKPVVRDENLITAIGFAFREFAIEVARAVGIDCSDDIFKGVTREYTEEELTYTLGEK